MKIYQKVIVGFILMAVFVAIGGFVSINISQKTLEDAVGKYHLALADNTINAIDGQIHGMIERVQIYAIDLAQEELLIESNQKFSQLENVQDYIEERDKAWTSTSGEKLTDFMTEIINNDLSNELRDEFELKEFYRKKYGHDIFSEVFVTNKFGANVAQTGRTTDYYQADEEWWQQSEQNGLYVSDMHYDRSSQTYSLSVCIKVENKEGEFLGVIKSIWDIKDIITILKQREKLKDDIFKFTLLNNNRRAIYSTDEHAILGKDEVANFYLNKSKIEEGNPRHFVTGGPGGGGVKKMVAISQSTGFEDFEGIGWYLIVEHDISNVFVPIKKLKTNYMKINGTITLFALALAFIISHSVYSPIKKLKKTINQINPDYLSAKRHTGQEDYLGEITAFINELIRDLKNSETSVSKLTSTIQKLNNDSVEKSEQTIIRD